MQILVVIDMQNDFIEGSLGTAEAVKIVSPVVKKIQDFAGEMIFVTKDTHQDDYLMTVEGKHLPVKHCIENTLGWELDARVSEALQQKEGQVPITYINKPTFASETLGEKLKAVAAGRLEIELVGLCTDICVVSNALLFEGVLPEVEIAVDASCCAGVTPKSH